MTDNSYMVYDETELLRTGDDPISCDNVSVLGHKLELRCEGEYSECKKMKFPKHINGIKVLCGKKVRVESRIGDDYKDALIMKVMVKDNNNVSNSCNIDKSMDNNRLFM